MKKNVPKFLIAKNEGAKSGSTYLVHTQEPPFVGELLKFDTPEDTVRHIEANLRIDIIQITPTCLLQVLKYIVNSDVQEAKPYLENKIVHWIIANYLNNGK